MQINIDIWLGNINVFPLVAAADGDQPDEKVPSISVRIGFGASCLSNRLRKVLAY